MSVEEPTPKREVAIEGRIVPWDKDTISVPEIREVGGFPSDSPVVAVDFATNEEQTLSEDDIHVVPALQDGKPLVKRMNFKRGS